MAMYASRILRLTIEELRSPQVKEVCFASDSPPAYFDADGVHYLDLGMLTAERVWEIHELCHLVADAPVEDIEHASEYSFVLRHIGRVHCTFSQRDGIYMLKVQRDTQAASLVEAIRPSPAPVLLAEATPDESAG